MVALTCGKCGKTNYDVSDRRIGGKVYTLCNVCAEKKRKGK